MIQANVAQLVEHSHGDVRRPHVEQSIRESRITVKGFYGLKPYGAETVALYK